MQRLISTSLMVVFLSSVILWAGCGGPAAEPVKKLPEPTTPTRAAASAKTTSPGTPDWFLNVPKDPKYLYAVGTAQSKDMQMALDKAKHYARVEIAKQVEVKIERSVEGPGDTEKNMEATVVYKETASVVILRGGRVSKQDVKKEGPSYRAYVLMEISIEEAKAALKAR